MESNSEEKKYSIREGLLSIAKKCNIRYNEKEFFEFDSIDYCDFLSRIETEFGLGAISEEVQRRMVSNGREPNEIQMHVGSEGRIIGIEGLVDYIFNSIK